MHLSIVTPVKIIFEDEIDQLTLPTQTGQITILPHHVGLLTKVEEGEIIIKKGGNEQFIAGAGGFLEVKNNRITILADFAVRSEAIETEKVLEAQKRAEERLKQAQEQASERDIALAQAELRRSILQLNIANRRKRRNI